MRSSNPLKAGLFIVISFAVAAAIFFGITGTGVLTDRSNDYLAVFDLDEDVGGLAVGSDVRIGGFIVGAVKSVEVADADGERPTIRVRFRVPAKYPIHTDAAVTVQAGITGLVNLNLAGLGKKSSPRAGADTPLDGQPGSLSVALTSFAGLGGEVTQTLQQWRPRGSAALDQVRVAASSADAALQSGKATIEHVKSKIDPAYDKYAGLADSAKGAMANLNDILGDGKGDIRETLANLNKATATIRDRLPQIADGVSDTIAGLKPTLEKASAALDDVKLIAANGRDLSASAKNLLAGNRGRLDEFVKSLSLAGQNLAAASSEIRRSPWRLLYTPSEGEVANQNLFDATRQLAEASRKVQDSSLALRDSLGDKSTSDEEIKTLLNRLDGDLDVYKKAESALWDRVKN